MSPSPSRPSSCSGHVAGTQDRTYLSFFDESVQGLEVDSPVKFRGVTNRTPSQPRRRDGPSPRSGSERALVEQLGPPGSALIARGDTAFSVHRNLRVQLGSQPAHRLKLSCSTTSTARRIRRSFLPFKRRATTIPTTPSTMKNLEDSVVRAANQFPDIAAALLDTITKLNALMDTVDHERLPSRASETLGEADSAMRELRAQLKALNAGALSAHAEKNLTELNQTLVGVNRLLTRLESDKGLMKSAERAATRWMKWRARATRGPRARAHYARSGVVRRARSDGSSILSSAIPDMLLKGRAAAAP